MYIDIHAHLRDFNEKHKETIAHALRVAQDSGLSAIFDMAANGNPLCIDEETVEARLATAYAEDSPVFYGLYIGLTAEPEQIKEAVQLHEKYFPKPGDRVGVVGLKYFAGRSVNDSISVIKEETQKGLYRTSGEVHYQGVLAVHCEKEASMNPGLWNSHVPRTHSLARPEESEYDSINDQIEFAIDEGFEGHLHICHVSTPQSVKLINSYKKYLKISCGATPHHLLLDTDIMEGKNGILFKVNPPLRAPETRQGLLKCFLNGEIDILESDHAPHTLQEKREKYMSGIPCLASWPDVRELLSERGMTEELLDNMAYHNVNRIFGLNIPRYPGEVKHGAHLKEYAFDPYASLKNKPLGSYEPSHSENRGFSDSSL